MTTLGFTLTKFPVSRHLPFGNCEGDTLVDLPGNYPYWIARKDFLDRNPRERGETPLVVAVVGTAASNSDVPRLG